MRFHRDQRMRFYPGRCMRFYRGGHMRFPGYIWRRTGAKCSPENACTATATSACILRFRTPIKHVSDANPYLQDGASGALPIRPKRVLQTHVICKQKRMRFADFQDPVSYEICTPSGPKRALFPPASGPSARAPGRRVPHGSPPPVRPAPAARRIHAAGALRAKGPHGVPQRAA